MSDQQSSRPGGIRWRLSRSLAVAFLGLSLLPIIVLTSISLIDQVANQRQTQIQRMSALADVGSAEAINWSENTQASLRLILNDARNRQIIFTLAETRDPEVRDDFAQTMRSLLASGSPFETLTLVDINGDVLASTNPELDTMGGNFAAEPWFKVTVEDPRYDLWGGAQVAMVGPLADTMVGSAVETSLGRNEIFYFATLVRRDSASPALGVLVGRTPVTSLQSHLQNALPTTVIGDTGDYYLVRPGQRYVVVPRYIPQTGLASREIPLAADEIVDEALAGGNGSGDWLDYRGVRVLGVYRWIDPLQMALVLKLDLNEVLAANRTFVVTNLIGLGVVGLVAVLASLLMSRQIAAPLRQLSDTAARISQGELNLDVPGSAMVEMGRLSASLQDMTKRLRTLIQSQDQMIEARTRQLEITARIGRVIAAETDLNRLLQTTIEVIRDQLGHYHAQVFMLDDLRQYAVLRSSTGRAGRELLERGHKLPVGSQSVVGQASSRGEPVLASDTRYADFWMPNPLLPETRAELAVPVRLGAEIIGVLDVQDTKPDTFDEATIRALQAVADQLAVAIRNAQLFEEKESLLSASLQLTQTLTRDGWDTYAGQRESAKESIGFRYDLANVLPVEAGDGDGENGGSGNGQGVRLPISLRGAVIGDLEAELPEGQELSQEQQQFVSQVLDRVALALENARLFEQTQFSLAETNRLYQASQEIAAADSMDSLVEVLLRLSAIDTIDRVTILQLDNPDEPPGGRWVQVLGMWLRDQSDPLHDLPKRLQTCQPPLVAIETVPPDGLVVNNAQTTPALSQPARENVVQMEAKAVAAFPFIVGRRTVGWLVMHSTRIVNAFTDSDTRFFQTVADQAATAFESLRLLQQAQIRARRLQATNDVSRAATSILNPDILLPMIVERISEAFDYYHAQIFLIDELGEWAVLRASTGEVGQELLRRGHKLAVASQSVIGRVTSEGEPVIARDTDTDAVHRRNELLPNTRAEMAIPLKTGQRVIGALDVQSTEVNAFDEEAQVILQSLADEISVTLENAQLFQDIQDRVAELTTVNFVSQSVSRAQTMEDLYEIVTVQLMKTFGAKHAYLGIVRGDTIELPIFIEGGERLESPPPQRLGTGLTSHVLQNKQVLLVNENLRSEAERLGARVIGVLPKSVLAVPLLLGDEAMGVISIQDAEKEHAYTDAHVRQLTTLAAYIAVKIRNAELLDEAERRAGELGFLFNVTRAAVATSDLDEALTSVASILQTEVPSAETSMVYLYDPSGEYLEPHAAVGYGREIAARMDRIPTGSGLVGMAARQGRPLIVGDARAEFNVPESERTQSAVVVPLQTVDQKVGVLTVESTRLGMFTSDQLRLLEAASSSLTAVIQNDRLLEEITEANARLQELDKLKSQFLANMSHELRTPLNSIIGFSRVMLKGIDGPLNDLQSQDLNTIYTSGQHLLGLINDILDVSKIEAGMMEIQPEYVGLEEIIDGVMATGRGLIKDKPIEIFKEVDDNLPQVWGDPVRLRQVLLNLVSNAAKFTHQGSITVKACRLDADPETGEPPRVQMDVLDTGIGVPEDKIETIFQAFQQVDGSTTRQYGGTGLGLPISRNFIELHGGRMWAVSEVGVGSTFSFTVPLHPPEEAGAAPSLILEGVENGKPLVLAVDDEQGVIDLFARYLEKEGFAVVGLNGARDLIRVAKEIRPTVIVLDINLPGKDGWQALDELRADDEVKDIPVIICTIDEADARAESAGVAGYLTKPVLEDDLLQALRAALSNGGQAAAPAEKAKTLNILIIEPDQAHAEKVSAVLVEHGHRVRSVSQGFEGLQAIQEYRPNVVIMDVDLSDMDGYGLLVSMRSHETTRKVPVLIVTARALSESELERLEHPHIRYLDKNAYQPDDLLDSLDQLTGQTEKG